MSGYQARYEKRLAEVSAAYGVSVDQAKTLRDAMYRTWSEVSFDIMDCFETEAELEAAFSDEAEMIAELTLDADRVTTFCPKLDLDWVYKLDNGKRRMDVIALGESILRASRV